MLNIVIPMAGRGSRFSKAGFKVPKPLISVNDVPMIELVVNNLRPECAHRFIFVCQQAHIEKYSLLQKLKKLSPNCVVIGIQGLTAGSACSVLMASDYINNDNALMIANSDQWIDCDINEFITYASTSHLDGLIMTMSADDPKWSYVKKDTLGNVYEVVEKKVVSSEATTGIYYFKHGSDFCREAIEMVSNNERSCGEFYVAPVYTKLYQSGRKKISSYRIDEGMFGLGTPEDLSAFVNNEQIAIKIKQC